VKETRPRTHCFIGALCLPGRKDHPRYVLVSKHKHPAKQLRVIRCSQTYGYPVQVWLRKLKELGFAPEVITLARVPIADAQKAKAIWVRLCIENGFPIYNTTPGRRRRPTLYVRHLRDQIIKQGPLKKRWMRSMVTLREKYLAEMGQRPV
jgi:hypothetical protein